MRQTVLACWAVVAALVVAVGAKPFHHQPGFDIAAAYENYHQIWMSEARRNSVRPMSVSQQVARSWPRKQAGARKAAPSAPAEENPPQEQLAAGPEAEKATADQKAQGPQKPQEEVATRQQTETQLAAEPQPTEATTVAAEPITTEAPVVEEVTTEMQTQEQTTQQASAQNTADTRSANKKLTPRRRRPMMPTQRPATDMQAAFDTFFNRWNAERLRNSIPPQATPIPPLSSSYYNTLRTRKQPVAPKPVDVAPAETPAETPAPEAPVDTLTQKASSSAPVAVAEAPISTALSLAQKEGNGNAPLIIILQHPGATVPMLG